MTNITDAERKKRLLKALPEDGSAVGNRRLAAALSFNPDKYFELRDELVAEGKVQIGRGRGGSVHLAQASRSGRKRAKPIKRSKNVERALYPGFLKSLQTWADAQGWTDKLVKQTADQGGRKTGGRYTRPDFIVVGSKRYEYTPGVIRDVETFEVKPLGALVDSVFEAAAHSRMATKSYLALQIATDEPTEDELGRIEQECQRFGVGLITFEDPSDYDRWEYRLDPVRSEPDPELLEQFVRDQIDPKSQQQIRKWM
jgi:hypothetical protein